MSKFVSFPKIHQFADAIRVVKHNTDFKGLNEAGEPIYLHDKPYPVEDYKGTVKLHGTNAAIVFDEEGKFHCQSRENIIAPQNDNAGFAAFVYALPEEVMNILKKPHIGIYGEWCGGNIQSSVGINGLPKMFVIFANRETHDSYEQNFIKYDGGEGTENDTKILNDHRIYYIEQFITFHLRIDFEHPEIAQNELVRVTEEVEKQCPVAKFFGKEGIGEGIVWKPMNYGTIFESNSGLWFKVKGNLHQSSKHKTLAPINIEEINNINELVDIVVTDSRVEQGIQKLKEAGKEVSVKSMGDFLKWINGDIISEEAELLNKSGIEHKKIFSKISARAKNMFLDKTKLMI